jgi:ubiquinone/menaquinone biosynthesis C-methylase UbiE
MREVNLLAALPKPRRDLRARQEARSPEVIEISRQHGELYFDGPRDYGYGGYRYDGRWLPVARAIVSHFGLEPGHRVLDIGCAKGFLVKDLLAVCPGLEAFGVDISEYALMHCEPEVVGRLHLGDAQELPFPDGGFQAVLSINTLHDLEREACLRAVREIERLAPGRGFIQVDSYRTAPQREVFANWVLTAKFHDYPEGWLALFAEAGYTGDYFWTIIE